MTFAKLRATRKYFSSTDLIPQHYRLIVSSIPEVLSGQPAHSKLPDLAMICQQNMPKPVDFTGQNRSPFSRAQTAKRHHV
jgi:hypothetical protein